MDPRLFAALTLSGLLMGAAQAEQLPGLPQPKVSYQPLPAAPSILDGAVDSLPPVRGSLLDAGPEIRPLSRQAPAGEVAGSRIELKRSEAGQPTRFRPAVRTLD